MFFSTQLLPPCSLPPSRSFLPPSLRPPSFLPSSLPSFLPSFPPSPPPSCTPSNFPPLASKSAPPAVWLPAGLYQAGPRNRYFDLKAVTGWLLNSFFQSLVVFVMVMGTLTPLYADRHSGRTAGQWQTGATLFTAVIITVHLEISSVIDHWTWIHAFAVTFSVCEYLMHVFIKQSASQSIKQPTNQPLNQSVNQSVNHLIN